MKIPFPFLVVIAIFAFFPIFAEDDLWNSSTSPDTKLVLPAGSSQAPAAFGGEALSFDVSQNTIDVAVLVNKRILNVTFTLSSSTKITNQAGAAELAATHPGEEVAGTYFTEGEKKNLVTLQINVLPKRKKK